MFRCLETSLRFGKAFPLLCKEGCIDRGHGLHLFGDMVNTLPCMASPQKEERHALERGVDHVSTSRIHAVSPAAGGLPPRPLSPVRDQAYKWEKGRAGLAELITLTASDFRNVREGSHDQAGSMGFPFLVEVKDHTTSGSVTLEFSELVANVPVSLETSLRFGKGVISFRGRSFRVTSLTGLPGGPAAHAPGWPVAGLLLSPIYQELDLR